MRFAIPFVVLGLALVACSKPGLVGKWKGNAADGKTNDTTEFLPDGKFVSQVHLEQGAMKLDMSASGTYTAEGEKISLTMTDIKIDESKLPAEVKAFLPQIKQGIDGQKGKKMDGTFKIEGDKLTITGSNMNGSYTRVK
jgi:hypothetical protein